MLSTVKNIDLLFPGHNHLLTWKFHWNPLITFGVTLMTIGKRVKKERQMLVKHDLIDGGKSEICFWFKYDLGQKYYAPQVCPNWYSNS